VCNEPMLICEYSAVELDLCAACHGIWLDAGELELLLGVDDAESVLNAGRAIGHEEKPRKCPVCRRRMAKERVGAGHPITYDHCTRGHGIWFDKGELREVLRHGDPGDRTGKVRRWLTDIFAAQHEQPGEDAVTSNEGAFGQGRG